jgi:hypothetical protein
MKKVFSLFIALCLGCLLIPASVFAVPVDAYTIITNPGEDASSEMNINWHMDQSTPSGKIIYTKKGDTNWKKAITVSGVCKANTVFEGMSSKDSSGTDIVEKPNIQRCTANLTNLESDTEYMYKVGSQNMSQSHYFKTAGAEEFSFLWISDWHAYTPLKGRLDAATNMINTALIVDPNVDFMFSTGDTAAWGGSYSFWKDMYSRDQYGNYMWASVNGNHDNMDKTNGKNSNKFFASVNNNPENGYDSQEGVCYYFKYNNVLFITLNNEILGTAVSSAAVMKAQEWVAQVIENNPSQYIFVAQHYEWFNGSTGGTRDYGYNRWNAFFDKYGVDLAMGGNNHIYARTHKLYNDKVSNDPTKGTVYMQAPSSDNERGQDMNAKLSYNADKIAYRFTEGPKTVGAILVTVNSTNVTTRLLNRNGEVLDTSEIKAKRSAYPIENFDKEEFEKSFSYSDSSLLDNVGVLTCSKIGVGYVNKIEYLDGDGNILATNPLTKQEQARFSISNNNLPSITAKIYYRDNTISEMPIITNVDSNKVSNLKIDLANDKYRLSWKYTGNDLDLKQWVFVDNQPIMEVELSSQECVLNDLKINSLVEMRDTKFSLSYRVKTRYITYGDVNFDGVIDLKDIVAIQNHVIGIVLLKEEEIRLADINLDGIVSTIDASYIHLLIGNKYDSINKQEYTVAFTDMKGFIIESKKVLVGGSIAAPEFSAPQGYKFIKWDQDYTNVTSDLVIKPICEALPTMIILYNNHVPLVGQTIELELILYPIHTTRDVIWKSSNTELAEVNNGVVTLKKAGLVTVTATSKIDSNIIGSIQITIIEKME